VNHRQAKRADTSAHPQGPSALEAEAAQERFGCLSRMRQQILLNELLSTRTAELMLAYPDLLAIGQGFRRRRTNARRVTGEIVSGERCVLFLVRTKFKCRSASRRRLPAHLYCHDVIRGRRVLLAIPTDVDEARPLVANAAPPSAVDVDGVGEYGVLTCRVDCRLPNGAVEQRVLSCRHVFGLSGIRAPDLPTAIISHEAKPIGNAVDVRGKLGSNVPSGFDAQLMQPLTPGAADHCLLRAHWPGGFASYAGEFETTMWLHFPRQSGPFRAHYRGIWIHLKVQYGTGETSFAANVGPVIEVDLDNSDAPRAGDSGSPLVIGFTKAKLAGMHIAGLVDNGDGRALSYCIPAYALLDPKNYAGAAGEVWELP